MSDESQALQLVSRAQLEDILEEHEKIVAEIRAELKRRREQAQHEEVDHLEKHMEDARIKFADLKLFLMEVLAELRGEKKTAD